MSIKVLYEDNHIIAVVKPSGFLTQPDKTGNTSMLDEVKKYLKEKYKKPGNVFLGLLHRLDRPVSGIILFAKTSKGASRLSEQFREKTIEKSYMALVVGKPEKDKGVLINILGKDEKLKKAKEYEDGREARLSYQVIKSNEKYSLLKVQIDGGQFHQIRAQLALAGFTIVGDVKYGGQKWANEKAIALCATEISFYCATEPKKTSLAIDFPKEWEQYLSTI